MDISLARHAFITGGASGIGLAIADSLAKRGVSITIADIDQAALDAAMASRSQRFFAVALDTRDRQQWKNAKSAAESKFGPVDILVNNAGIAPDGRDFADMDPASFDRIVGINLFGVFNGVSAFAADMRSRRSGHIVNVSSMAGLVAPAPGIGAYAAAKFGVVAISEVLRKELAPHGVGVSVLCPGLVATNLKDTTLKLGGTLRNPNGTMEGGMTPSVVGELVIQGIIDNARYIITHPEQWSAVEKRMKAIEEAFHAGKPS
jgi:NAD(P)-dependent dehydrogenase (short-subunit alcohol dehydrogenase family)